MNSPLREAVPCDLCGADNPLPLVTKNSYRVVRCRACDLVYVSPRPRPESLVRIYETDKFQAHQVERAEDTTSDTAWRKMAERRLSLIEGHAPRRGKLLDVGCSTGGFMSVALAAGWQASGLDVSQGSVDKARQSGLDARLATLEDHGFPDGSFDAVTMFDSIEHMPSPMAALGAVRRLLAPGGVVEITTPNVDGLFPRLTWTLFGRPFGVWEHPTPPGHVYQFGARTLASALDRAGFDIVHQETEAIALDHTVGEIEEVLVGVLKGNAGRPTAEDARVDVEAPPPRKSAPAGGSTAARYARRAARQGLRAGAWALTAPVAGLAPFMGGGDSLVVLARRR